jgi:hypothetical protein
MDHVGLLRLSFSANSKALKTLCALFPQHRRVYQDQIKTQWMSGRITADDLFIEKWLLQKESSPARA